MKHWPIQPLLHDEELGPITTREAWEKKAARIRSLFRETIGPRPASQYYRGHELSAKVSEGGVTRELVRVRLDDDEFMEAWLLYPTDPARKNGRAALAMHPTTDHGKEQTAGLVTQTQNDLDRAYGLELARRGWTVVAPDLFAVTRRLPKGDKAYDTASLYRKFPEWSAVGKTVSDLQITLDVMERLEETRGLPVSTIGHSLGGHAVLFLGVVDPRPVQTVCNAGFYPFADSALRAHFFRDSWYIYLKHAGLKQSVIGGPRPLWDMHELAAVHCPRRLMILGAGNDEHMLSYAGLCRSVEEIAGLYDFAGAAGNFAALVHGDGHSFLPWHRASAYAWMETGIHG
jgi:hypothetical protein